MLDARLKAAADFVRKGSTAADIGTDHGYLPIYLIENEISPFVIASDIRKGPISSAKRNAEKSGLLDCISCRLGGGLSTLEPREALDIIIAGMGGELIASIISDCGWAKCEDINFILQPMTKPEALRRFLSENSFEIINERAVKDSGKLYTIINCRFSPLATVLCEPDFYTGKLRGETSEYAREYLLLQGERIKKKIKGLEVSGENTAALQKVFQTILEAAGVNEK